MKTDLALKQDVIAELSWEPAVNAAHIGVEVSDAVVTLSGHVETYAEKWNAERAAQRVSGVKALAVEIDVKLAGLNERSDADIARAVENVLQWTDSVPHDSIKVQVEKGWITLSGSVDWHYQRQLACTAVRFLMGVKGISDHLSIVSGVSSAVVKADIEAALKRHAKADAHNILVDISGSKVTLAGSVHSWSERELARHAAWDAPGVRDVVDHMTVTR